jgi:formamidopyrimidine-DNA glycosylase
MPEGIEICITAQFLNRKLKNKKILSCSVNGGKFKRDGINGIDSINLNKHDKIIKSVNNKGKLLWFEITSKDETIYLISSMGLVGYWSFHHDKYSHVHIIIEDSKGEQYSLYYTDHRNFGNMSFTNDYEKLKSKLDSLAPDLLKEDFTNDDFYKRVVSKNKSIQKKEIIKILMDQNTTGLGSGIGNYLVNEILYRAKISPHTPLQQLSDSKLLCDQLAYSIRYTMRLSYETNITGYMEHLDNFLDLHRKLLSSGELPTYHKTTPLKDGDKFMYQVYQQKKDPFGNLVTKESIVTGRTAFWVKSIQQ